MRHLKPISDKALMEKCPPIFSKEPKPIVSKKYQFISTLSIIKEMRNIGWYPVAAEYRHGRGNDTNIYQRHLVRFQKSDLQFNNEAIEAVLSNSHNKSCGYSMRAGIYRLICSNGLVIGRDITEYNHRHLNITYDEILSNSEAVVREAYQILQIASKMKSILLSGSQQKELAKQALISINKSDKFDSSLLLKPRREIDKKNDLWTIYNVIQENIMKGGVTYSKENKDGKTKIKLTRPINNITKNIRYNSKLWNLANAFLN